MNLSSRFYLSILVLLAAPKLVHAEPGDWAATVYAARISSVPGWEDLIIDSMRASFTDAYLIAGALSRRYAQRRDGNLLFEAEGQAVYNFGDQSHWELNAVPAVVRWTKFPWNHRVT